MMLRIVQLRLLRPALIIAGLTAGSDSVLASTATATYSVSASVQATCLISGNSLGFGTYTGSLISATTTLSVTCTSSTGYNVGLNAGTASGATVTTRAMTGPGGATLSYALYQDSGHGTNWGQTVGTDTEAGTANG